MDYMDKELNGAVSNINSVYYIKLFYWKKNLRQLFFSVIGPFVGAPSNVQPNLSLQHMVSMFSLVFQK